MRKFFSILLLLSLFLTSFGFNSTVTEASSQWGTNFSGTIGYSFVGYGWGSVQYDVAPKEEWEWDLNYKRAVSLKRQVNVSYDDFCPYTCRVEFTNRYYNSSDGDYITGQSIYSYSSGSYWATWNDANRENYSYINSKDIYASINNYLNLKTTVGAYYYNNGWGFAGANDHWGYIR